MTPFEREERRSLPALAELLGPFGGFEARRGKQVQLHAALQPLALRLQGNAPRLFPGMREVAAHFGVSLWTVLSVYRRLEREGLLARIRASHTVVLAKAGTQRQVAVRGVVALVNWLPGFLHTPDQRYVVMRMERILYDHGFAAELVFYHEEDKRDPEFARRILSHRPNYAIWLTPAPVDEPTLEAVADAGVRLIPITDQSVRTRTPQYGIGWSEGWRAALGCWRREGIDRVVIPRPAWHLRPIRPVLERAFAEQGYGVEYRYFDDSATAERYLGELAAFDGGVLFESDIWHAWLCTQAPRAFARLLAARPVLQSWPLPIERDLLEGLRTDALQMPWDDIIDRIVEELCSGQLRLRREDARFEAVWRHNIPAKELSRLHAYERV